ncbi:hypothetical protein B0H16DRAFT_1661803 [Mycena metata]|uniref:MULE transposase domain-containing protein n=1 Tax=Mycena metata TaxID=1033252 RepID=A0AAD7JE91_9AGAR|nr:hypothetical protein B0H16DRAFT_1661803 [Mycena metata]
MNSTSLPNLIRNVPALTKKKLDPKGIIKKLRMNDTARDAALHHIEAMGMDTMRFSNSPKDQGNSHQLPSIPITEILTFTDFSLHLPNEINRDARSKLVIVTSIKDTVNAVDKSRKLTRYRAIYQCQCGSDHTSGRLASKKREMAWENVDCGCWFRITTTHYEPSTDASTSAHMLLTIDEILGDFTHSAICLDTHTIDRNPQIPLHPLVRDHALSLLRKNIPLAQLRQHCREFSHARWGVEVGDDSYRYVLMDYESTSLYRTIARESGIPQRSTAQDNLHLWFNKEKPQPPDPRFSAACVAYSPYIPDETDRFSIILMTPEQKLLAWKYGHRRQVLMDLTFGVCNGRALLAIVMAIDDENKGLPLAFMMFTAKKETKAVHADDDKVLLEGLLKLWKTDMGTNAAGEEFESFVGSTDNDPRERHGLRKNWTAIILLLCLFHVWQAWRNALNRYLRVITKGPERQFIRSHLAKFLMKLLKEINNYDDAITAYNAQVLHFKTLAKSRAGKDQSKGALAFLTYLQAYLKVRDFWKSWSLAGVDEAAARMGVPVSQIA